MSPRKKRRQQTASFKTGRDKGREFIQAFDEIKGHAKELELHLRELRRKMDCLCHGGLGVGGELIKTATKFDELSRKLSRKNG